MRSSRLWPECIPYIPTLLSIKVFAFYLSAASSWLIRLLNLIRENRKFAMSTEK